MATVIAEVEMYVVELEVLFRLLGIDERDGPVLPTVHHVNRRTGREIEGGIQQQCTQSALTS